MVIHHAQDLGRFAVGSLLCEQVVIVDNCIAVKERLVEPFNDRNSVIVIDGKCVCSVRVFLGVYCDSFS